MGKPGYDPTTGKPVFDPATGKPALNCRSSCLDQDCDTSGLGDVTVTVDIEPCNCASGDYAFHAYQEPPVTPPGVSARWMWLGGLCGITFFRLDLDCLGDDGTWRVQIWEMSIITPTVVFEGIFTTEITCVGGAITGTVELPGGPGDELDCTGCTATVTF